VAKHFGVSRQAIYDLKKGNGNRGTKQTAPVKLVKRVRFIAEDITRFINLHVGWAVLLQKPDIIDIPKVNEYGS
jgi:hypothetical protein